MKIFSYGLTTVQSSARPVWRSVILVGVLSGAVPGALSLRRSASQVLECSGTRLLLRSAGPVLGLFGARLVQSSARPVWRSVILVGVLSGAVPGTLSLRRSASQVLECSETRLLLRSAGPVLGLFGARLVHVEGYLTLQGIVRLSGIIRYRT